MPGFNRTGPKGAGPRTGRGLGYCGNTTDNLTFGFGRSLGRGRGFGGRGRGFGWRNRFCAVGTPGWVPLTPEQEVADLKAQADLMKEQLEAIQKHIEEISSK
jgi:hypothetical protein